MVTVTSSRSYVTNGAVVKGAVLATLLVHEVKMHHLTELYRAIIGFIIIAIQEWLMQQLLSKTERVKSAFFDWLLLLFFT